MIDNELDKKERVNPFFLPYNTPHDTVPFDRITLADYEEAMMEGIRRDDEEIEKIINNPDEPTFDNTIIPEDDVKAVLRVCSLICLVLRHAMKWTHWHRR